MPGIVRLSTKELDELIERVEAEGGNPTEFKKLRSEFTEIQPQKPARLLTKYCKWHIIAIEENPAMSGRLNLWGEIEENEVVKIAGEVTKKRGYAIYADYNEYMRQKICKGRLEPVHAGFFLFLIRETLMRNKWIPNPHNPETRFYPPSTTSTEELKLMKNERR